MFSMYFFSRSTGTISVSSSCTTHSLEQVELDCYGIMADLVHDDPLGNDHHDDLVNATIMPSPEGYSDVVQRLLDSEEDFVTLMETGMQRYSMPLRHCMISGAEHSTLFQNVEKVA